MIQCITLTYYIIYEYKILLDKAYLLGKDELEFEAKNKCEFLIGSIKLEQKKADELCTPHIGDLKY